MKTNNEDLLDFMQYIVGCEYHSDLKTYDYNEKGKLLLERLNLIHFSFDSIKDAIEYLAQEEYDI